MAARRRQRERQATDMAEPAVAEPGLWQDLRPVLDQELSRLPDKYRAVVLLCDLEGKTRKEAARQLQVPEGTVAGRLARARALLARRLARHAPAVSAGSLAALASPDGASACVPAPVVTSTIRAATLFASGQAAGVISADVAVLTEGVLKSMLLTKIKTTTVAVLVACLLSAGATGLVCRAVAGQQSERTREQPQSAPTAKDQPEPEKELRALKSELARLRAENEELRGRLRKQTGNEKSDESKLVFKVYPVAGLTSPPDPEGKEAQSLLRVITNSVAPASWSVAGGEGSLEYFPEGTSLVIRQPLEIQKQVQALLEDLRKSKEEQEKSNKQQSIQ